MSQNLQNLVKFQKFQLDNLVDFEKCCKTRIFLQKSVPIQPKTSNILPKFCRSAVVSPTGAEPPRREGYSEGLVLAVLRELEKTYLRDGKIRPEGSVPGARARFTRLVLGCIGTDLCKKIRVLQYFSKSTRLSS